MQRVSCCVLVIDIATRWLLWAESIIWLLCHSLGVRKTNFSGISPANPNPSEIWYTYRNQGATTFRKFWERSAKWEQNWRFRRLLRRRFLCAINQIRFYFANFPTIDFHQIWPRRLNPYPLEIARDFRKKNQFMCHLLASKNLKTDGGSTGRPTGQPTARGTHCKRMLFSPVSGSFQRPIIPTK